MEIVQFTCNGPRMTDWELATETEACEWVMNVQTNFKLFLGIILIVCLCFVVCVACIEELAFVSKEQLLFFYIPLQGLCASWGREQ